MQERIGAVIIINKRILLVGDDKTSFLWSPGGKIEDNENHESTIRRELKEELDLEPRNITLYLRANTFNDLAGETQIGNYYLVDTKGKITPKNEITRLHWYSKADFLNNNPKISSGLREVLLPKLIQDGLL